MDEKIDSVLQYLKDKTSYLPIQHILDKLEIPKEYAGTIVNTLEANNHISVKDERFNWPSIKITPEGKEFLSRTCYQDEQNNSEIKKHHVLFAETGYYFNVPFKVLEYKKAQLEIEHLKKIINDYPKTKKRVERNEIILWIGIVLSVITMIKEC